MKKKEDIIKYYFAQDYRLMKFKFKELPDNKSKTINFITEFIIRRINDKIKSDPNLKEGDKYRLLDKLMDIGIILEDLKR